MYTTYSLPTNRYDKYQPKEIIFTCVDKYVESVQVEKLVHRLKNVLKSASENNPSMYNKTKLKYRELASELLDCVGFIADMLEEDLLDNSAEYVIDEFQELSVPHQDAEEQKAVSDEIQMKAKKIEAKMTAITQETPVTHKDPRNKHTISMFGKILSELPDSEYETDEAKECATYISRWWQVRFNPDNKNPNFRYNMTKLPEWIDSIIIAFGKYKHDKKISRFRKQFDSWLLSVETDLDNIYSTPFFIHELYNSTDPDNFTDEAVDIASELYGGGLNRLKSSAASGSLRVTISPLSVWNKVQEIRKED